MSPILLVFLGIAVGGIVVFAVFQMKKQRQDNGQEISALNQRFDTLGNSLNQALRDTVKMVADQLKDTRESTERASQTVHKQVEGFTSGLTQLTENLKQVHTSIKDVSSFQNIFKSPKLRGIWGEASLESTLQQFFPREGYELQHYFKSGEAVDAILRLPNNLILPVDSKFNWENFEKMVNAPPPTPGSGEPSAEQYKKLFFADVKKKIDEIASKYVIPAEGTTDLALMYVPAETVYYEIINNIKDVDLPSYARTKKVWLVSPNTFGLSVSAIRHWFKDVQLTSQTKEIMKRLERIASDGKKLGDDFRVLGRHLDNARGAYEDTEKRVVLLVDRVDRVVQIEGNGEEKKQIQEQN